MPEVKKRTSTKTKVAKKAKPKTPSKKVITKAVAKKPTKKQTKKSTKKPASTKVKTPTVKVVSKNKTPLKKQAEETFLSPKKDGVFTSQKDVVLPSTTSLRLKRKVAAISSLVSDDFLIPATRVAFVTGLCFVLLGATVAISNTTSLALTAKTFLASVASSTHDSGTANTINTTTNNITQNAKLLSISPQIPSKLDNKEQFLISTASTEQVIIELVSLSNGSPLSVPVTKVNSDSYKFTIDPAVLEPSDYKVGVSLKGLNGIIIKDELARFSVLSTGQSPQIDLVTSIPSSLDSDFEAVVAALHTEGPEFYLVNKDTKKQISLTATGLQELGHYKVPILALSYASGDYEFWIGYNPTDSSPYRNDKLAQFTVQGSNSIDTSLDTTETTLEAAVTPAAEEVSKVIEIKSYVSTFTKPDTIYVTAPLDSSFVRIYYRSELSTTISPLGYAVKGSDRWLYRIDPTKLPNGKYYLSAKAMYKKELLTSSPYRITVSIPVQQPLLEPETEPVVDNVKPLDTTQQVAPTASVDSDFEPKVEERLFTNLDDAQSVQEPAKEQSAETDALLIEHREEINALLKKYSIARQSGDEALIESARKQLLKKRDEIVNSVLLNSELRPLVDKITQSLTERIENLQKNIDTYEELRRSNTGGESAVDTDGDGISDTDERLLFKTDPNVADSDNDGINDGAEVIGGFNPLDDSPEAIIKHESPREAKAFVDEETLKIERVSPVVRRDVNQNLPPVSAEISGRGIPNSFVTLYVFSTPTVVTVKTDADGSFAYTFDEELEDGEHEVYVAVTDNTGAIVAQSNPFRFIKEAQAFTPQDDREVPPVINSVEDNGKSNPYIAITGMGILGLGLILLIIGLGLREQKPKVKMTEPDVAPA